MFKKPEDVRMTKEEAENYGREIDARNAQYENVEITSSKEVLSAEQAPPPLTENEIRQRVGEQNYKNSMDNDSQSSINS